MEIGKTKISGRFLATALAVVAVGGLVMHLALNDKPKAKRSKLDPQQSECVGAVSKNYLSTSLAMSERSMATVGGDTPEMIIARRRLQEQYCLRIAQCFVIGQTNEAAATMTYSAMFWSCLRDETLDEYDEVRKPQ